MCKAWRTKELTANYTRPKAKVARQWDGRPARGMEGDGRLKSKPYIVRLAPSYR